MTVSSSDRAREANREACKRYREKNRALLREKAAARRAADPEKVRAASRKSMAKAIARDPEKYRQVWREKNRREYRANPARILSRNKAYRNKKVTPSWADRFVIQEMYELARLRTEMTSAVWEVDHIVPLQSELVCGLHVESNLRVVPRRLNRTKGNATWPGHPNPEKDAPARQSFFS